MSHVIVMPWQNEKKPPPLRSDEVDCMAFEVQNTLRLLVEALNLGLDGVEDRFRVLHGVAVALRDGQRVKATITVEDE